MDHKPYHIEIVRSLITKFENWFPTTKYNFEVTAINLTGQVDSFIVKNKSDVPNTDCTYIYVEVDWTRSDAVMGAVHDTYVDGKRTEQEFCTYRFYSRHNDQVIMDRMRSDRKFYRQLRNNDMFYYQYHCIDKNG
jgi:hypothetical protein